MVKLKANGQPTQLGLEIPGGYSQGLSLCEDHSPLASPRVVARRSHAGEPEVQDRGVQWAAGGPGAQQGLWDRDGVRWGELGKRKGPEEALGL